MSMSTVSNTTNATNSNILHLHQLPAKKLKYIITKLQEYVDRELIPKQTADAIETSLNHQQENLTYMEGIYKLFQSKPSSKQIINDEDIQEQIFSPLVFLGLKDLTDAMTGDDPAASKLAAKQIAIIWEIMNVCHDKPFWNAPTAVGLTPALTLSFTSNNENKTKGTTTNDKMNSQCFGITSNEKINLHETGDIIQPNELNMDFTNQYNAVTNTIMNGILNNISTQTASFRTPKKVHQDIAKLYMTIFEKSMVIYFIYPCTHSNNSKHCIHLYILTHTATKDSLGRKQWNQKLTFGMYRLIKKNNLHLAVNVDNIHDIINDNVDMVRTKYVDAGINKKVITRKLVKERMYKVLTKYI